MVYATFFNGTTTLETALSMGPADIIQKFEAFAKKPDSYAVQEEARNSMDPAVLAIKAIYERYKKLKRHPGYIEDSSKPPKLNCLTVTYQGSTFNLRTLYDIVGWILSVVGSVPVIATRENYYYPLMMIGYVFCAKLIPKDTTVKQGAGPPEVWSVMWFKQTNSKQQVMRVVVGANLDQPEKNTKKDAQIYRRGLLDDSGILGWKDKGSVMQQTNPRAQDFGHCAETYPLLFVCSLGHGQEATAIQKSTEGLAVNASLLYNESPAKFDITPYESANSALMNPCLNCEWLLGYGEGFQISHFTPQKRVLP